MCGIIGSIGKALSHQTFEKATDSLAHRGPNDRGVFVDEKNLVYFGHRRLSIIDLSSAGHQPMATPEGRYTITYNGEIYNYLELKEELKGKYRFTTKTDTEVLLAAYATWGEDCLQKLNGMFAFAIWDAQEKALFCARDRLGEKPFYYTVADGAFAFASEIKALRALGVKSVANERIIYDYLSHGFYDHTNETFFNGILKLPAGTYGFLKGDTFSVTPYWDLAEVAPRADGLSFKEAETRFRELLADSIRLRFRSDVPVGVNLSSGLDSNSLLYFAKEVTKGDLHTFSMCLESAEYNECPLIGSFLGVDEQKNWHLAYFDPSEVFRLAELMNEMQDEPYGGIPTIAYSSLNESAQKNGVTVLLEGQGLDELLAGYHYFRDDFEEEVGGRTAVPPQKQSVKNSDTAALFGVSQDKTVAVDDSILNTAFLAGHEHRRVDIPQPFNSRLLNAQYRDIVFTKLPRVLRFNDHVSMRYGRELRLPFLDHRIVEFCFSLPQRFKMNAKEQKVLVRRAMAPFLPEIVRAKPKKAFGAIQNEWLRKYHGTYIFDLLHSDSFRSRPYWDHDKLLEKTRKFFLGEGDNSFFLWQAVNLELWLRKFIDQ